MSSHLLTEIERVCDYLVVIEGGRARAVGQRRHLHGPHRRRHGRGRRSRRGPRRATSQERGYDAREGNHTLELDLTDDGAYDAIRDGAASLQLGLIRIEQRRQHLEDLFRDEAEDEVTATRV